MTYEQRVRRYEAEGMTRSDAQGIVDLEDMRQLKGATMTHTQGPYRVAKHDSLKNVFHVDAGPHGYERTTIAIVSGKEAEGNATLLAAAPAMYEALNSAMDELNIDGTFSATELMATIEAVRANILLPALRLAEGRA